MSQLMTIQCVREFLGLSRSTIYAYIKSSAFPRPIKLGGGVNRWRRAEIEAWVAAQPRATIRVDDAP